VLKIVFVRSEDNEADIFSKNPTEETFSQKIVEEVDDSIEAGDKINCAFPIPTNAEIYRKLYEWEAGMKNGAYDDLEDFLQHEIDWYNLGCG
jgi:hypothetical protein